MKRRTMVAVFTALLAGCTVGPDYRRPEAPAVDRYVPGPPPATDGMPLLVTERAPPSQWWRTFGSAELDALVAKALRDSPTIEEAAARVAQARELETARRGATTWPQVDLTAGAVRQRIDPATVGFPNAPNPGPFNVFSLGGKVHYDFDVFGAARRELEGLAAQVDYRGYELEAARQQLAGNVVAAVLARATAAAQLAITQDVLDVRRRTLAITQARYELGGVAWVEVQNLRVLVADTEAQVAPLVAEVAVQAHRIAVLCGEPPATAVVPLVRLSELRLPAEVPLAVPAELVRRRPDIAGAEALLRKASADVGLATADLYPKIAISGSFSSSQLALADVLGNGINLWSIGLNLVQPLLRGGELQARKRAAEAAYAQALAAYRQTVLLAFGDVADQIRRLEADVQGVRVRTEQSARAEDAWRITAERYRLGGVAELALLDAERQRLAAELARIAGEGARMAGVAALYQSMGAAVAEPAASVTPGPGSSADATQARARNPFGQAHSHIDAAGNPGL